MPAVVSHRIFGTLKSGEEAGMRLTLEPPGVWAQQALTESARHLNRVYIGGESFSQIVTTWLRCDWRNYIIDDDEAPKHGAAARKGM